jgi:hypothetical protein
LQAGFEDVEGVDDDGGEEACGEARDAGSVVRNGRDRIGRAIEEDINMIRRWTDI